MDSKLTIQHAQRMIGNGRLEAAVALLEKCLAENDPEPELQHMLAHIRMLQARLSEAVPLPKRALSLHDAKSHRPDRSLVNSQATSSALPLKVKVLFRMSADAADHEEWTLIEATAAERQSRRRFFRPQAEFEKVNPARASILSHLDEDAARTTAQRQPHFADSSMPPTAESTVQVEALVASTDRAEELSGTKRSLSKSQSAMPRSPDGAVAYQAEVGFDFDDDDFEDQAQRHPEESLEGFLDAIEADEEDIPEVEVDDDLESLFDVTSSKECSAFDWEELTLDADGFDEAPIREDLIEVQADGELTRRQRARQHAIGLGMQFDWDEDGIALLTEVFDRYWWSQAKESMRRELQAGMEPQELKLALDLREIWSSHPEFAMDFSRLNRNTAEQRASAIYRNLSWPMALALVRVTERYPEIDCLEHFLCELFDEWYTHGFFGRHLGSFNAFLFFRLGMAHRELQEWPQWNFEPDESLHLEFDDEFEPGFCTPTYRLLDRLGLIPRVTETSCEPEPAAKLRELAQPASNPIRPERKEKAAEQSRVAFEGNRILQFGRDALSRNHEKRFPSEDYARSENEMRRQSVSYRTRLPRPSCLASRSEIRGVRPGIMQAWNQMSVYQRRGALRGLGHFGGTDDYAQCRWEDLLDEVKQRLFEYYGSDGGVLVSGENSAFDSGS